jgi:hypothetical protein
MKIMTATPRKRRSRLRRIATVSDLTVLVIRCSKVVFVYFAALLTEDLLSLFQYDNLCNVPYWIRQE